jgi:integrase
MRELTDSSKTQRWLCRECGYRFSLNGGGELLKKGKIRFKRCPEFPDAMLDSADFKPVHFLSGKKSVDNFSFMFGENIASHGYEPPFPTVEKSINAFVPYSREHRVCAKKAKNLEPQTEINTVAGVTPQEIAKTNGKIIEYAWWLKKEGYSEATIIGRSKLLKILAKRGANIFDPESVKTTIAKQAWSLGRKANAVDAYTTFLKMTGGQWQPPRYEGVHKIPYIPKENEIDQIISGCSNRMATFLQLLKETGARCGEAWQLKWSDIDLETDTVRITPEKGSNPRIARLSKKLVSMLNALPKNYKERIFSNPGQPVDNYRDNYCEQRKRIAHKLQNPRLQRITFHSLRHWKATMEYHRTKDILYVKQLLGHKRIENTLKYVQLAEGLFKNEVEYVSKVAKTEGEACVLVEAGFDFICDINGNKLFRKKKY